MFSVEQSELQADIAKALKGGEFATERAQVGDVFVGARIAGADTDEALLVARTVHTSELLRAEAAAVGGFLVGAREFLAPNTGDNNG